MQNNTNILRELEEIEQACHSQFSYSIHTCASNSRRGTVSCLILGQCRRRKTLKKYSLHFGSDPVDIRIRINPEIYIRIPVHF